MGKHPRRQIRNRGTHQDFDAPHRRLGASLRPDADQECRRRLRPSAGSGWRIRGRRPQHPKSPGTRRRSRDCPGHGAHGEEDSSRSDARQVDRAGPPHAATRLVPRHMGCAVSYWSSPEAVPGSALGLGRFRRGRGGAQGLALAAPLSEPHLDEHLKSHPDQHRGEDHSGEWRLGAPEEELHLGRVEVLQDQREHQGGDDGDECPDAELAGLPERSGGGLLVHCGGSSSWREA